MSDIDLTAPADGDRSDWARLWRAYLDFYGTTLPEAAYDAAFAQVTSDDARAFRGLIARVDGVAAGLVHWVWHPHMWRPEGVVYLQDLFVDPAARGTGLGRRLIEAVYADADARGTPSVYWLTRADNPARALYDRVAARTDFVKYQRPAA